MDDFDAFVRAQGPALSRFAYLLSGDSGHAEDLVQSALWKAHRAWDRIVDVEFPSAYVRQMVVREYLSWRRRRWTTEVALPLEQLDSVGRSTSDHGGSIVEADAVRPILDALPRKQRAVLVMRYYLDLSDDDIATAMSCSRGTVRSNASRALQSLRDSLPSRWEEAVHESD